MPYMEPGFNDISIHALLAESDSPIIEHDLNNVSISIHALLAESDIAHLNYDIVTPYFYPRSPCGERH